MNPLAPKIERRKPYYDSSFETIEIRLDTLADHMETISIALKENTELTRQTAVLAEATARDTEGLVKLAKLSEATASAVSTSTKHVSRASKLLIPIFVAGSILATLWQGHLPSWETIIKAIK